MDERTLLSIVWQIGDQEWKKATDARQENAPSSEYDQSLTPLYDLLYGCVQINYAGLNLFPEWHAPCQGIQVSVLAIAEGLSSALFAGFEAVPDGVQTRFVEPEFRTEVSFEKQHGSVVMRTNLPGSHELVVPQEALIEGARTFLAQFVGEIKERAPGLLDWESLAPLRGL